MRPRSVGAPDSSPSFPNAPLVTEILLLDDDPLQLKLLARALNGLGYHNVVGCTTAAVALDALNAPERSIGLIFLDLNMPDVDGVAFLRLLAESHRSIPVVLVSGEDERLVETAARLGASHQLTVLGTLPKPVWPVELRALLARWESPAPAASGAPAAYAAGDVTRAVRHGELVTYYQPKVDLVTGAVAGVEALVRWRHPLHGDVLPGRFLGVVEEQGLIGELTRVVIGAALSQADEWRQDGLQLSVAVNVSMDDLAQVDFADYVLAELDRHGVPPSDLVLEVAEPRLAKDPHAVMEVVSRLRLKRVTMSIDDFGTGHSSLAQVRDLPFNEVKIDGSFLHGAGSNATLAALFTASVDMARRIGMRTVAEGVEDSVDWAWLRSRNCDQAQGFFLGRPMPADELRHWLAGWEQRRRELFPA